jgi:nucleoside-diphosphate-sugar epimerase
LAAADTRIVITGASGWIGKATLELLYNTLGAEAFRERVVAFGSSRREVDFGEDRAIEQRALGEIARLSNAPSFVLHLAFLTKDKVAGMDEREYRRANRALSQCVLDALDVIGAKAVFVASSGAAAFAEDPAVSIAMRLYGSLKKADEDSFARWAEEGGRRAVVARIFALSGPHINKHENYALASFIKDALAGRSIAIRADFPVYRSYVAVRELMSVVFAAMLEEGHEVVRFATGGERLEMQQIAQIVSDALGPVAIDRPPLRTDRADEYTASDVAYRQLLSRFGIEHLPFSQQVVETAAFFALDQDRLGLAKQPSRRAGAAPELADKRTI